MGKALNFFLPSDIEYLELIIDITEAFLLLSDIEEKVADHVVASVSEAAANAIIHGNDNDSEKKVYLSMEIFEEIITVTIEDESNKFDEFIKYYDNNDEVDLLSSSGRGFMIMRAYMDELICRKGKKGNLLILRKRVK